MRDRLRRVSFRTSIIYWVVGALWILLSDRILVLLVSDPETIGTIAMLKGWLFVTVTAALLYGVLRTQLTRWEKEAAERRRAEEALRESEAKWRSYVEGAPIAVVVMDGQARAVECNPAAAALFGRPPAEWLGCPLAELVVAEDRGAVAAGLAGLTAGGRFDGECRIGRPDGAQVWVSLRSVGAGAGRAMAFCGDITDRKRTEIALREQGQILRHAQSMALLGPWTADLKRGVFQVPADTAAILGWAEGEHPAAELPGIIHPADLPRMQESWARAMREGAYDIEHRLIKDGGTRWVHVKAEVTRDAKGEPLSAVGVTQDVTERKRLEQRLAARNAVRRVLAEAESIAATTPKLLEAVCRADGWDFGEYWEPTRERRLRCTALWHLPLPGLAEMAERTRAVVFGPGEGLAGEVFARGEPVFVRDFAGAAYPRSPWAAQAGLRTAFAIPIWDGKTIVGVLGFLARELREPDPQGIEAFAAIGSQIGGFVVRQRARDEMRRVLAVNPVVLYSLRIDPGHNHLSWVSENITRLTGYPPDHRFDREWWIGGIHPDDRERVLAANPVPYTFERQELEFRFRCANGDYIWLRDEKRLVRDADGQPVEIVGAWTDITDRVKLETQLRQAQKMEAVGQLAGGVAHDFNNILAAMMMHVDLAQTAENLDPEMRECLRELKAEAMRAAGLTRQLLLFSRRSVLQMRRLDLNQVVEEVLKMLRRLIGEHVRLEWSPAPRLPVVEADAGMVEQVIMNLVVNARDAMPAGGRIHLSTAVLSLDADARARHAEARAGRFVCLAVADTGTGIPPDVLKHMFEPFFTTKEEGKGTGLGLATADGIARQHGGWIEVESTVGEGSTFRVLLPVAAEEAASDLAVVEEKTSRGGGETILLAEDEPSVRRTLTIYLGRAGYRVLDAPDGPAALELWNRHRDSIQLLLSDMVMPGGISGLQLAQRLRRERPRIGVVILSGYSDELSQRGGLDPDMGFVAKPCAPAEIAAAVRRQLEAAARRGGG